MRIHSITVRNYRVIREQHLEINGSLMLLSSPNETGKSTLIEAVHRGLFLKSKTTGDALKSMVSDRHYGDPEVEVKFEAKGSTFSIAKKFSGSKGTTLLTEIGGATLRNDDAESKLAELLDVKTTGGGRGAGERSAQQWAHLWVWQGQSGDDPTIHATNQKDSLLARLQGQGGAVAMQSVFDTIVADRLARQYAELFGNNGNPKRDSDLGSAMRDLESVEIELQNAQSTLAKLQQAVADLQEADQKITACNKNSVDLNSEIMKVEEKLDQVHSLRSEEKILEPAAQTAVAKYDVLFEADTKIRNMRKEVNKLTEVLEFRKIETARLQGQKANALQQTNQAEIDYQVAIDLARQVNLDQELATLYVTFFDKKAQFDQISEKLLRAKALRKRVEDLETELTRLPFITPITLKKLQELHSNWSSAKAALQAMAVGVEVLATDQTVQVGGQILVIGESHILTEDSDITIGPRISIRIKPGGGATLQDARSGVRDSLRALNKELDALRISSIELAIETCTIQQQLSADISAEKAQLIGLGYDSIQEDFNGLEKNLRAVEAEMGQREILSLEALKPKTAIEAQCLKSQNKNKQRECELQQLNCKSIRDAAVKARQEASDTLVKHQESLQEEANVLNGLEAQLRMVLENHGNDESRSSQLINFLANKTSAEAILSDTRITLAKLQPDLLESDHARHERAIIQCQATMNEATTKRAVARNILQSDGSTDPQVALAVAEAKMQSTKVQLESYQRHAKAVQLLHQLFLDEKSAMSERFTRPFAAKIKGYLQCLFGANVNVNVRLEDDKFCGLEIVRPEQEASAIPFDNLSAGAKEQLGAAVRLAMAEVLAENHDKCLPVVFDDAFTKSDPNRIATLQRMLDRAANKGLQIIVLTCTPSNYVSLGARGIELKTN